MSRETVIILVILLFFCARAEEKRKVLTEITLDKAIEIALKENSQVKIAGLDLEKAESKVSESFSPLYPALNAEGSYNRNIKKPVFFLPDFSGKTNEVTPIEIGANNSYTASLRLNLPLFAGQLYSGIIISKLGLQAAEINLRETKAQIKLNVQKAFYDLLLSEESLRVINESMNNAKKNLNNAEKLFERGILSEFEYLSAQVEFEKIKPSVLQAESNYDIALNFLKALLNLSAGDSLSIAGSLTDEVNYSRNFPSNLEGLVSNSYALTKLTLQKKIADESISLLRWGCFPSLNATGSYQYQTQAEDFVFNNYRWVKSITVGIAFNVPIFSGFGTMNRIEQAEIASKQLDESINFSQKQISIAVKNTLNKINTAAQKIEAQKLNKEKARLNYRIAELRYKEGMSTQLEISSANLNLLSAELGYQSAVYEHKIAAAELDFYLSANINQQ